MPINLQLKEQINVLHLNLLTIFFAYSYCHTLKSIYGVCLIVTSLASSFAYLRWYHQKGYKSKMSRVLFWIDETQSKLIWLVVLLLVIINCTSLHFFNIPAIILIVGNCLYCLIIYSDIYFSDAHNSDDSDSET